MVGVPGKSKACHTCRKRRAKCDLLQPKCSQCKRQGLPCGGYGRAFIFVNNTSSEAQTGSFKFEKTSYSVPEAERRVKPLAICAHELSSSASEEGIVGSFWSTYLPNGRAASTEVNQYSLYGWTTIVQELYRKNEMIRVGLLAVALNRAAQLQNNIKMLQKSHEFYGRTLIAVGKAIQQQSKQPVHATLAALKLLGFYELWSGPNQYNNSNHFQTWCSHINGCTAYLMLKDPRVFQEGHAHQLFVDSRLAQAIIGIGLRKSTPLANEVWKTVPWRKIKKTPKDELVDILIEFPAIYAELDTIKSLRLENQCFNRAELITKCWSLSRDLQQWVDTSGRTAVDFAEEKINASGSEPGSSPSSEDLAKGLLILVYWSCCILLYDIIDTETSHSQTVDAAKILSEYTNPQFYCRKIANLLPFFLNSTSGDFILHKGLSSISIALSYLSKEEQDSPSEEKLLLLHAFKGEIGKTAATFLKSYQSSSGHQGRSFFE